MARKKIDRRILELVQRSYASRHRCMFLISGTKARDQVPFLHHLLLRCRRECGVEEKPSVLWCFKKMDQGLTGHQQKKKLKQLRKQYSGGGSDISGDSAFDHFLLSADPQFCHYSETDRVLGRTFSLAVVEDLEAVTPNVLARIAECVEGGGAIALLLTHPHCPTLPHLAQLPLDAHARFVTESHPLVRPLFHGRTIRSLPPPTCCILMDDQLHVTLLNPTPHPTHWDQGEPESSLSLPPVVPSSLTDSEHAVFSLCRTDDQRNALACLHGALEGDTSALVSLTAGRGRGKSAVLGLAVAMAMESGMSSVLLTSPHVENVQALLAFVARGLEAAGWKEGVDFHVVRDASSSLSTSVRVSRGRGRVRWVRHLPPTHTPSAGVKSTDLLVIDEAAAIPLPLVRQWIEAEGTVFMASTIQGYEGTGRSLSLKLLQELRNPDNRKTGGVLREVKLCEAIRYGNGDPVERWLGRLLCLEEAGGHPVLDAELPPAQDCQLFLVNRRVLFGCSVGAEGFLQRLVWLFVSSHYKNSPNDLLMMADAPAHALFCLLSPSHTTPLCAIQVSLEGGVSVESCRSQQENGRRGAGDLIPWIVAQQFQDQDFPSLKSARIVRIATHPDCQRMGYGQRALSLLSEFYSKRGPIESKTDSAPEESGPITLQNALLSRLENVPLAEPLDYLGVSYGLTPELLKFWKRAGFLPLYIRQTTSDVTGEHSCVMVKSLQKDGGVPWLHDYCSDFRRRFTALLPTAFRLLPSSTASQLLREDCAQDDRGLVMRVGEREVGRLSAYCRGEVDYHLVLDVVPKMAPLMHTLNHAQGCVVLGVGLQGKSVEKAGNELGLDPSRVLGLFRKAISRMLATLVQREAFNDKIRSTTEEDNQQNKSKKFKRSVEYCEEAVIKNL